MKKFILTAVFALILLNFAKSQNVWVPGATVLNSGSPTNVGIGISAPATTLHVEGDDVLFQVDDVLFEGNNFRTGSGNTISGNVSGALGENNQISNNTRYSFALGNEHQLDESEASVILGEGNFLQNGHGSVSIGGHNFQNGYYTYAIGQGLTVGNPLGSTSRNRLNTIAIGSGLIHNTANSLMVGFSNSPITTPTLFVGKAGGTGPDRVGVNILNPQEDLHVDGVIRSNSLAGIGTRGVCADTDGNLIISGACGGGGLPDNLGNHIATQPLHMNCLEIHDSADQTFCNGNAIIQSGGPELISAGQFSVAGPMASSFFPYNFMFSVNGDAAILGQLYVSSDKRYKKNIKSINNALDLVTQLNGVSYEYDRKNHPSKNFTEGNTYGFIAQELDEVLPNVTRKDAEGYFTVNYDAIIPILTEAISEQQEIIAEKTDRIENLEKRLTKIEALLSSGLNSIEETNNEKVGLSSTFIPIKSNSTLPFAY